jgi:hypothetical protein
VDHQRGRADRGQGLAPSFVVRDRVVTLHRRARLKSRRTRSSAASFHHTGGSSPRPSREGAATSRGIRGTPDRRAIRLHHGRGSAPHRDRACPTPYRLAHPTAREAHFLSAGRTRCPLAGGLQQVTPCRRGCVDRRVRRRCSAHGRARSGTRIGGSADRPPNLEGVAAGRTSPQDHFRCGEDRGAPTYDTAAS